MVMAGFAVGRELPGDMRRIGGLVVFLFVAGKTGIWRTGVIAVMAGEAIPGNCSVCPFQGIIAVMDWECGRLPIGISGVTCLAGVGYGQRNMVWIG